MFENLLTNNNLLQIDYYMCETIEKMHLIKIIMKYMSYII